MAVDDELDQTLAVLRSVPPAEPDGPFGPGQRQPVDLDLAGVTPVPWPELWGIDPSGEDWCFEPILPRGRQAGVFSPAGAGKSLLLLDVAAAKSSGRPILG